MQILPGGIRIVPIPATAGIALLSGDQGGSGLEGGSGGEGAGNGALGIIGLIAIPIALLFGVGGLLVESPPPPTSTVNVQSTAAPTSGSVQTATPTPLDAPSSPTQFPVIRQSKVKAE